MNTISVNKKETTKKLIELPSDVCKRLAIHAAAMGTSVKKLIEKMVINSVDEYDDETFLSYLHSREAVNDEFYPVDIAADIRSSYGEAISHSDGKINLPRAQDVIF